MQLGAALIADQHYRKTADKLKKVRAGTKIHVAPQKKTSLTKEKKEYRKAVIETRTRVESPFSAICQKFEALKYPFAEDEVQLEYLVKTAIGVHNFNVDDHK